MKKKNVIGLVAGIAAGAAVAAAGYVATAKVVKEIKADLNDKEILSPEGNNKITLKCGISDFAKGLAFVKVIAANENGEDECKFSFLAGKSAKNASYEWVDNDHFEITVGEGKLKQCCDVDFSGEQICLFYYWQKDAAPVVDMIELVEEVVEDAEEVVEEAAEEAAEVAEAAEETVAEAAEEAAEAVEETAEATEEAVETNEEA